MEVLLQTGPFSVLYISMVRKGCIRRDAGVFHQAVRTIRYRCL